MRKTKANLARQQEQQGMAALRGWHTLTPADSARIVCSMPECQNQATQCEHVPHMVNREASLSFGYFCEQHANSIKKTQELRELQNRRGELEIMLRYNGRAFIMFDDVSVLVDKKKDPCDIEYYSVRLASTPRAEPYYRKIYTTFADVHTFLLGFGEYGYAQNWHINLSEVE